MKTKMRSPNGILRDATRLIFMLLLLLFLMLLPFGASLPVRAQKTRAAATPDQEFDAGRGMSLLNADLMLIAAQTDFFLQFGKELNLTDEQRKKLEDLYFDTQKYTLRQNVELNVADAELQRLVSNDRVDLALVRAKVKQIEALRSEATFKKIEAVLRSVAVLTHEQHIKVMLLVREILKQEDSSPQIS